MWQGVELQLVEPLGVMLSIWHCLCAPSLQGLQAH
jgi:hypothetical protein